MLRMAPASLSACDMGTSFSSKAVDSVCLVSAESVLGTEFVAVLWVSDHVRIHAEGAWKCHSRCRSERRTRPPAGAGMGQVMSAHPQQGTAADLL